MAASTHGCYQEGSGHRGTHGCSHEGPGRRGTHGYPQDRPKRWSTHGCCYEGPKRQSTHGCYHEGLSSPSTHGCYQEIPKHRGTRGCYPKAPPPPAPTGAPRTAPSTHGCSLPRCRGPSGQSPPFSRPKRRFEPKSSRFAPEITFFLLFFFKIVCFFAWGPRFGAKKHRIRPLGRFCTIFWGQ